MVAGHLQIKKNFYYMVLNLKDEKGKRKPKWIPTGIRAAGKKAEKQAEDMLLETRLSYKEPTIHETNAGKVGEADKAGKVRMTSDMLFSDFMLSWLGIIRNSVEEVTYAGYVSNVKKRIVPFFQELGVTLEQVTPLDIEDFYACCFNELNLKGSTVQHFHANIHKALKYAARHDLIESNPMDKVDRPKADEFVGAFYSLEEVEQLFDAAKGDPAEFPILMAAFYGLRRSEVMGLRWQSIDFESNTISIEHKTVQFCFEGKVHIVSKDRMKNKSSFRSLPLVPQFRELLLHMRERQATCRELCGKCYVESDYIYVNDLGEQFRPNYVTQHFRLLLEKHGLRIIRYHDLRHTCASLLLKNNISMKDIQEWLGHSNYSTTANTYAHLETASKKKAASTMAGAISIDPGIQAAV